MRTMLPVASRAARLDPSLRLFAALITTLILFAFAAVPPAGAQKSEAAPFSSADLKAFASASLRIEKLNDKWMPRIERAQGTEEEQARRRAAMSEMTAAVRDEGLTVEEYNTIYHEATSNPELASLIDDYRQDQK